MEHLKEIIYNYGIIEILIAFGLKLMDNALGTAKTVYLAKERYLRGAVFAALSTYFYLIAIVRITQNNSNASIIAMCIATLVGTYIPGRLIKKSEKDRLYIYDITGNSFDISIKLADTIKENNIAVRTEVAYNQEVEKTLVLKVYCPTKNESSSVIDILNSEKFKGKTKWHVYVPVNDD